MDLRNKHIAIAGAARSGISAALMVKNQGGTPFVTDSGPIADKVKEMLDTHHIGFEENGHTGRSSSGDFLIVSPGIPTESPIVQSYLSTGKKVYSEIEVASWFSNSPIVAVTGSNGKTTVVKWLHHTWNLAGRKSVVAGNVGTAFSAVVESTSPNTDALLEVSSFQLDHIETFRPDVSILLNLTPDHLDRYDHSFEKYSHTKFKITENQTVSDTFILNMDDPVVARIGHSFVWRNGPPTILEFSSRKEVRQGAFLRNDNIILKINHKEELLMNIGELNLKGRHNLSNGMATALAARASEIKNEYVRESLRTFEGVAHRLEFVRKLDGVSYINDSKATNVNAVWYALDRFDMPVVLILGGRDKGNDYMELEDQLREKVHTLITLGESSDRIQSQLKGVVPHIKQAVSMKDAVKKARQAAKRGEIVLLSPACASFDMFDSYEDRGHQFKQAVIDL